MDILSPAACRSPRPPSSLLQKHANPFYRVQGISPTCPARKMNSGPPPMTLRVEAGRGIARRDSAKVRNRRSQRKFNGSPTKPRLSVFCSAKQLYAMLVDDQNKMTLFYASTCRNPSVGSHLVPLWKLLKGWGRNSSRRARSRASPRYLLMIAMVLLVGRGCQLSRFQSPNMGSC